jgi:hypothetical protein
MKERRVSKKEMKDGFDTNNRLKMEYKQTRHTSSIKPMK